MIGWLQGQVSDPWQQGARCGLLLVCQGVGYEVQLSQRHWQELPAAGGSLALHIHHAIRDDGWTSTASRSASSGICSASWWP